uniref:Uncharacterized protein n=1 Tax=Tanacetum cinerariifolium TaxID=118510 RepID=A0A6L2KLJ9_TANCI|nr:hypothetical protein [Tanacetum cinerariifolium]
MLSDAEIVSPLDVHIHHEVPSQQTPTLLIVPFSVITDSSPVFSTIIPQSLPSFTPPPQQSSPTPPITEATNPQSAFPNFVSILIDKIDKSKSYLVTPEHRDCYEGLKKSYDLDNNFFSTYGKVYSLKRSRKDKDKDKDPSAGSDQRLKKRKTNKDAEPAKGPKAKESQSSSCKGDKSKSKSSRKFVQSEEPVFEVTDSEMPHDQEENLDNYDKPKEKVATNCDWFIKPSQPQEPTDTDWNASKTIDELISTPIDFSAFIMNGLNINNLTQKTLLGPAFRLLKGTCSNYAELEYDFEECYRAFLEKLDWENPEGDDYPFDLTKPLPLVKIRNRQKVPVDYFFNNDLKYLQGGTSTRTYTTSLTKTKAAQYDLLGIEAWFQTFGVLLKSPMINMHFEESHIRGNNNRLTNLLGGDVSDFAIALRMFTRSLVIQKQVEDLQLRVESYQKKINVTKPETTKFRIKKRDPYPYQDPQGFIYVDDNGRNRLMCSDELYKFNDGTLTRL